MIQIPTAYVLTALAVLVLAAVCASIPLARILALAWNAAGSRVGRYVALAAFVIASIFAGAKHGSVTFPFTDPETRYLFDAGSYVTNDYVRVAFTRSPLVPLSADLLGYVRPTGSTNDAEWAEMLNTTFARFSSPSNIPYAGAISNDFQFFTTWTPGPTVHTNGVAVILWQKPYDGATNRLAAIRTGIYVNGRRLAPNPAITNGPPIVIQATLTTPSNNPTQGETPNE